MITRQHRGLTVQHRRKIAEAQALEEKQLREEKQIQRQKARALTDLTNFLTFLLNCHTLSMVIDVITDPTPTTQEGTAKPSQRYYSS
ncbi:hypothetical protein PABG_03712 [Paracoccidioides brasiliensis Pb03]|nr:hypothetical protein PABG_03712 [Paracoccidioides brasiliensis Pb03]ODH51867.1 hypothetical protein GX48_01876 [Paracoccidioides brasiliensis]